MKQVITGSDYNPKLDKKRLETQMDQIKDFMLRRGNAFASLDLISNETDHPHASVSAQLRNLRKLGYVIEKKRILDGLWVYRMTGKKTKVKAKPKKYSGIVEWMDDPTRGTYPTGKPIYGNAWPDLAGKKTKMTLEIL